MSGSGVANGATIYLPQTHVSSSAHGPGSVPLEGCGARLDLARSTRVAQARFQVGLGRGHAASGPPWHVRRCASHWQPEGGNRQHRGTQSTLRLEP
eukprot:1007047-Rhodomonas_salina.2